MGIGKNILKGVACLVLAGGLLAGGVAAGIHKDAIKDFFTTRHEQTQTVDKDTEADTGEETPKENEGPGQNENPGQTEDPGQNENPGQNEDPGEQEEQIQELDYLIAGNSIVGYKGNKTILDDVPSSYDLVINKNNVIDTIIFTTIESVMQMSDEDYMTLATHALKIEAHNGDIQEFNNLRESERYMQTYQDPTVLFPLTMKVYETKIVAGDTFLVSELGEEFGTSETSSITELVLPENITFIAVDALKYLPRDCRVVIQCDDLEKINFYNVVHLKDTYPEINFVLGENLQRAVIDHYNSLEEPENPGQNEEPQEEAQDIVDYNLTYGGVFDQVTYFGNRDTISIPEHFGVVEERIDSITFVSDENMSALEKVRSAFCVSGCNVSLKVNDTVYARFNGVFTYQNGGSSVLSTANEIEVSGYRFHLNDQYDYKFTYLEQINCNSNVYSQIQAIIIPSTTLSIRPACFDVFTNANLYLHLEYANGLSAENIYQIVNSLAGTNSTATIIINQTQQQAVSDYCTQNSYTMPTNLSCK